MEPVIIGVAGGTGSGKTTIAQAVLERRGACHRAVFRSSSTMHYTEPERTTSAQRAHRLTTRLVGERAADRAPKKLSSGWLSTYSV